MNVCVCECVRAVAYLQAVKASVEVWHFLNSAKDKINYLDEWKVCLVVKHCLSGSDTRMFSHHGFALR